MAKVRTPLSVPVLLIAVLVLLMSTVLAVGMSYRASQRVLRNHTTSTLDTTVRLLDTWQHQYSQALPVITDYAEFQRLSGRLIDEWGRDAARDDANTRALEEFLVPRYRRLGYQDYAILAPDHRFLASSVRNWTGIRIELQALRELLDETLAGDTPKMRPMIARLYGKSSTSRRLTPPRLLIASAVSMPSAPGIFQSMKMPSNAAPSRSISSSACSPEYASTTSQA